MAIEESEKWEIDDTEEPEEDERDNIKFEISYYPSDLTLKGYLDKWENDHLIIPTFQRNYVWDQVQASKLIESFLLGLPVPGVFLYKQRNTNKLLIIDGQQRILTSIKYFKGTFGEKKFRLKNVRNEWEGKSYEELNESDRLQLDDTVLRATVVQQLDPEDDSSIYYIFERLNTGGMKLNAMEVRRCVYYSAYFEMLEILNKIESWRTLISKPVEDKRFRDTELILRILSLYEDLAVYDKPMKGFLSKFLLKKKKMSAEKLAEDIVSVQISFKDTCDFLLETLPEKPFHLRGRINYGALDSIFCAAMHFDKKDPISFSQKYTELVNDKDFMESCTVSTSDSVVLQKRFKIAYEKILGN